MNRDRCRGNLKDLARASLGGDCGVLPASNFPGRGGDEGWEAMPGEGTSWGRGPTVFTAHSEDGVASS